MRIFCSLCLLKICSTWMTWVAGSSWAWTIPRICFDRNPRFLRWCLWSIGWEFDQPFEKLNSGSCCSCYHLMKSCCQISNSSCLVEMNMKARLFRYHYHRGWWLKILHLWKRHALSFLYQVDHQSAMALTLYSAHQILNSHLRFLHLLHSLILSHSPMILNSQQPKLHLCLGGPSTTFPSQV